MTLNRMHLSLVLIGRTYQLKDQCFKIFDVDDYIDNNNNFTLYILIITDILKKNSDTSIHTITLTQTTHKHTKSHRRLYILNNN